MAEQPARRVEIRQWQGLVSNRGPFQGRPGSALVQRNCRTLLPGILEPRAGLRPLFFNAPVGYEPPAASSSSSSSASDTGCRDTVTLTLAGFADGVFPCCDDMDGTYVIDISNDIDNVICQWFIQKVFICSGTLYSYWFSVLANETVILVHMTLDSALGPVSGSYTYRKTGTFTYPFSGTHELTFDEAESDDTVCDGSATTMTVVIP